jgi:hypothetical protein
VTPDHVSRRQFVLTAAAALATARSARARQATLTAGEVVDRIKANVGVTWRQQTVDGFKAGDPSTVVTGIFTTVMTTMVVLREAASRRHNLVVTLEPTFYTANDNPGPRATDPVYLAKRAFIDEQKLVVWRFADHWNARRPSETVAALAATLGWTGYRSADNDQIYEVPETTLGDVIGRIRDRFGVLGGIRTVGPKDMRVRTVFLSPGTTDVPSVARNLSRTDLVIAGEPREWEAVPYLADSWSAGQGKGMIALGRIVSESPGMRACAAWIRTIATEVPVQPLTLADPYWNPAV